MLRTSARLIRPTLGISKKIAFDLATYLAYAKIGQTLRDTKAMAKPNYPIKTNVQQFKETSDYGAKKWPKVRKIPIFKH